MQFEEAFDIQIPDEDAEKIKTVKDADDYIETNRRRQGNNMPARRVVVTGLGLICGVGNTAPAVWEGLMAGKSGMADITAFDLTGHPVRFAAEVKDFDPQLFVDKKEARKMGRFIHFALAAADEAMKHSGLQITPENAASASTSAPASAASTYRARAHQPDDRWPAQDLAVLHSRIDREPGCRPCLDPLRRQGPE